MISLGFEKMGFLLSILAALLVIEGIPYFGFPNAVKKWAQFLQNMPEKNLRLMGFSIMAAGILILYALRSI